MKRPDAVLDAALEECLAAIARGEEPEAALARFPELESDLRPLLWAADSIASLPGLASVERAAMRQELEQLARTMRGDPGGAAPPPANGSLGPGGGWPLLVAAGIAVGVAAAGVGLLREGPGGPVGGLWPRAGTPTTTTTREADPGAAPGERGGGSNGEPTRGESGRAEGDEDAQRVADVSGSDASGGAVGADPSAAAAPSATEGTDGRDGTPGAGNESSTATVDATEARPTATVTATAAPGARGTGEPATRPRPTGPGADVAPGAARGQARESQTPAPWAGAAAPPVVTRPSAPRASPSPEPSRPREVRDLRGLAGRAVGADGRPLAEAFVLAYREDGAGPWLVDVDDDGAWRLDLEAGVYRLRLLHGGDAATWYDGVARRADATPLRVPPDGGLVDIELRRRRLP